MTITSHTLFARERRIIVLSSLLLALVVLQLSSWIIAAPFMLFTGLLIYLFRDLSRKVPASPLAVVSPIDGCILSIEEAMQDPYLERESIRITMRVNLMGGYGVRSPIEGLVKERWEVGGQNTAVESGNENVSMKDGKKIATWIQTDEEDDVVLVLNKHSLLQKPSWYIQWGHRVGQGRRAGMMRFAGEVELYLPKDTRLNVSENDCLLAGSAIIGTFLHN